MAYTRTNVLCQHQARFGNGNAVVCLIIHTVLWHIFNEK